MAPDTWSGVVTAGVAVLTALATGGSAGAIAVYRICRRLGRMERSIGRLLRAAGLPVEEEDER